MRGVWAALAWCIAVGVVAAEPEGAHAVQVAASPSEGEDESRSNPELPELKLSGFVQAQASLPLGGRADAEPGPMSFFIRRARLRLEARLGHGFGGQILIDAADVQALLKNAYVTWSPGEFLELRVGQQKTHFGFENPRSSTELYWINRSGVSELGRGKDLRDIGLGALGKVRVTPSLQLAYALTLVNGAGPNVLVDDTPRKNLWGRAGFVWTLRETLKLEGGASGGLGDQQVDPDAPIPTRFWRAGADLSVDSRYFFAAIEGVLGADETLPASGFFGAVAGKTPWNLGPVARYELTLRGDEERRRLLFGVYWDALPKRARVHLNYEREVLPAPGAHALLIQLQGIFDR